MNPYLPILAACTSTALGGAVAVATRAIVDVVDPVQLGVIRYGIAVLCLLPGALWLGASRFRRADLLPMAVVGVMFFSVFPIGFALSLKYTTASQGALVLSLMPILNMIMAGLAKQEIITRNKVLGGLCVVLGVGLVVDLDGGVASDALRGNLIMFLMAVIGAAFNLLARPYLQRYNQLQMTAWFMTWGWIVMFITTLSTGTLALTLPPLDTWWVLFLLGSLGGAVPIFLFNWALGHIESTLVSVSLGLNPLTAAIFGVWLLSEPLTVYLVLGLALVLSGIVVANWRSRKSYEHFD